MTYQKILDVINQNINKNGKEKITGDVMNSVLKLLLDFINKPTKDYAKNDATSLTTKNVTAWQKKLGVADLKFDDKAITTTQNYADFGLVAGASINAFNNAVYTSLQKKLDAPAVNATNEYVILGDGSTTPKGDLGKNFANTDLVVSSNRKHTGTASVELGMPFICSNASVSYSGLVDKSADATYNKLLGVDATGNLAKVNGNTIFVNQPDNLTDTEKTTWKTKMNGGYSTSTMSVGLITPPLVDKKDRNYWITLLGSNLNLNPSSYKVWLVSVDTNLEYEIGLNGNGGVQLYTNGTSLVFYYNFKNLPIGKYKVKLFNGVAYYTTGALYTVNVIENVVTRDLSSLTWKTKVLNDASTTSVASGNSVLFKHPESIVKADDSSYVLAFLSSDFAIADENFSIDIVFERAYSNRNTGSWVFAGLVDGSIGTPNLLNQTLCYAGFRGNDSLAVIQGFANNQNTSFASSGTYIYSYNIKITMIRQGNQLTVVYVGSNGTAFSSTTVPTGPMKIGLYVQNCAMSNHTGGITLSNFFTFN